MAFFTKKEGPTENGAPENAAPAERTLPIGESAFLKKDAPATAHDDIFQNLGENFFGDAPANAQKGAKKRDPLEVSAQVLDGALKIGIVATIVFGLDSTVRGLETPGFLENLPVCEYLSLGIEGYENAECRTVRQILETKAAERKQVESTIANNLLVLVPKRLEAGDVLNSPEIQFIKERTGDSRIAFSRVIDAFQDIVKKSEYRGEDIECAGFKFNEKGELSVSCEFYGDSLSSSSSKESRSSRITALAFLSRLDSSEFRLLNPPKTLDIQKYSSADVGIRSTFSTVTKVQLKMRYVPANGNRQ